MKRFVNDRFELAMVFAMVIGGLVAIHRIPAATTTAGPRLVEWKVTEVGPRALEDATQASIERDYSAAWTNLAASLEFNAPQMLDGWFEGNARTEFRNAIAAQQKSGLHLSYPKQHHALEAIFYAPEGDLIELQDTAQYDDQLWDGQKLIQSRPVVAHYFVLMTPSADRWVIRELQEQPLP
jgi:hypothetical protein